MRQSINTKYVPPTNYKGSRVSVRTTGGIRRIYEWDDSLNPDQNHTAAARRLIEELGWNRHCNGAWVPGATREGLVYVFTYLNPLEDMDSELIIPATKGITHA